MKHWTVIVLCGMTIGALLISCGGGKEEFNVPGMDIAIKNVPSQKIAYAEIIGPYSEIGDNLNALSFWGEQNGLATSTVLMGIFYDDPGVVPAFKLKSEVAMTVPMNTQPDSVYPVRELPEMTVASVVLKGPHDDITKRYGEVFGWVAQNNYSVEGPLFEIYLKCGKDIPETEYETEIRIPVKKIS